MLVTSRSFSTGELDLVAELRAAGLTVAFGDHEHERDIAVGDRRVRASDWRVERTRQLGNLVVGIVGVGRIGRAVAARLSGFGSRMLGHDPGVSPEELRRLGIEPVSLPELVRESDIITLHCPGEWLLVDAAFLGQVKPGCILINTARAALVDESAVAVALQSGALGRYAADTLGWESAATSSPLLTGSLADRTLFTPHAAAQTVEAVDRMGRGAVAAVLAVLRGEIPPHVVAAGGSPKQVVR